MRQLYYTIRYLLRGRGGNVIKVLSLTLGLGVGLILFARVAFELSFDTFFDQVEDLYSVHVRYNDDKTGEEDEFVSYLPRSRRLCGKSSPRYSTRRFAGEGTGPYCIMVRIGSSLV
ncbi:MAG: hypothetical protein ACLR4U_05310 [Parabacteroides distasonis]